MDYFYDIFDAFAYFFILLSVPNHFSCIEKSIVKQNFVFFPTEVIRVWNAMRVS